MQRLGRFPCVTGRRWSVWASSALRCVQVSTARRLLLASTASCPGVYGCAGAAGSGFADARDIVCGAGGCLQAFFVTFRAKTSWFGCSRRLGGRFRVSCSGWWPVSPLFRTFFDPGRSASVLRKNLDFGCTRGVVCHFHFPGAKARGAHDVSIPHRLVSVVFGRRPPWGCLRATLWRRSRS